MKHCRLFFLLLLTRSVAPSLPAVEFATDILPILADNCFHCHGPDAADRRGKLRLDTREGALKVIDLSNPMHSELLKRIHHPDAEERMPPIKSKRTLTTIQKTALRTWIEAGAPWEKHWAFEPPTRPNVPAPAMPNPIDSFIRARLAEAQITPAPEAPPETLIRRATFDLTGLPPTPAEVDAFLKARANNPEAAYETLIDRLLDSPRYGEHMALDWLDAARYADTDGYQFDGPRFMWRWRDWVINAYNTHMPFDQFTIEQLAGDLLPDSTIEQRIATGFNRNHRYNSEAGLVVEEFLLENAVDRVDTTATLWMGLTIGCARCHDHKYDPISIREYYQLIAFFNSIPEGGRAIKAKNSEPVMPAPTKAQQAELAALEQKVASAKAALESQEIEQALEHWTAQVKSGQTRIDKPLLNRGRTLHWSLDPENPPIKNASYVDGVFGKAVKLTGTQTVSASPPKGVSGLRANDSFSICFWLRIDAPQDGIIFSRQKGGHTRPGVALELVDGRLQFDLISRWIAGVGRVTTVDPISPGTWMHVVISNDGSQSANGQHIYIDGQRVTVKSSHNTNSNVGGVDAKASVQLGGGVHGNHTEGAVDDLRIYNRDLWPDEVFTLAEPVYAAKIATQASGNRTERQQAKLRAWFFEHGAAEPIRTLHQNWVTARNQRDSYIKRLPTVMVMQETASPKPTYVRTRGVYHQKGERVQRDVPEIFPPLPKNETRNRLDLARWLVSGDHPLTARVAVNRYWQKFFGVGLVKTAEDFGIQGEAPSHPKLLDWLATEFVDSGWDVARLQKLMLMSATYRQSSVARPELRDVDPDNRLLARAPRLRLSAQAIRDTALSNAGLLVERIGGPSVSPYQPPNMWAEMSMGMKYKQSKGEALHRRSLYTIWKRTVAPPTMSVFDAAGREACEVKFRRTNTPLQALTLLNETGYVEAARHLGARMLREGGRDLVGFGFRAVTTRNPTALERSALERAWKNYRTNYEQDAAAAKALIQIGESPTPKDLDPKQLAAATALGNVLLNLDEAITRE